MKKWRLNNWLIILLGAICFMCNSSTKNVIKLTDSANSIYKLEVNSSNLKINVVGQSVLSDSIAGLFINESPVVKTKVQKQEKELVEFLATTQKGESAAVSLTYKNGVAKIVVIPNKQQKNKVSIRFKGMPVAHGLGDAGAWGESFNLVKNKKHHYSIVNNGGSKRWLSTFTIFPKNQFATVFFGRGKKSVDISEDMFHMNTEIAGASTFYLFMGEPKVIYANYKRVRKEEGYEDIRPKSRLFELGWESWDALGWNTNQFTVKDILAKFHKQGYPIRWAVTGSGFWDKGGTTTSFGRYGKKFPDTKSFSQWMHQNDIYWMIGLRTNLIPSGGPYYPKTKKRDKNLKVRSFYGNDLSDVALGKGYLLKDAKNEVIQMTSSIFPIVPCYLIDGNVPGAAQWYQKQYAEWKVDGIKEDTMMDLKGETSIFNKPIAKIATEGGLVMARCGEISSPGTLQRINDTGVGSMAKRTPINYMQYAACGFPNVYSDVAGVHNMHNTKAISANIRHTWMLSLTAGLAVGAYPSKWSPKEQKMFKKAIDYHYELVPYMFSAGMETFETGYPYTLTPMSIAYADNERAVAFDKFQWMIGESVLATPLLKNYKTGKKDIFIPEGTWYDWEKHVGPKVLKDQVLPLDKAPCFVGGKGIVILRSAKNDQLIARIYKVNSKAKSNFYTLEKGEKYTVEVKNTKLETARVYSVSGKEVKAKQFENYMEFAVEEGVSYVIK
jgi:alpha-glucosidase (family GH31 glycosyl hydrolase)